MPYPGEVSTCITEPIASTSLRQIDSPRPEPEKAYSPGFCRRRNGSNRVAMDCGGMPRPVSRTENSMQRASGWTAVTSTKPSAVNLRALVVRLSRTRLSATGWPIRKSASGQDQPHREILFLGDRLHDVPHRLQNVGDRERNRVQVHQAVAAPGQLDDVAGHGAETKRSAVNQAKLSLLHRIDRAAASPLEGLRQKQNRGKRRAKVVSYFHHQLQPVRRGEPVGEVLGPVRLQMQADPFDGVEDLEQLTRIRRRAARGPVQ